MFVVFLVGSKNMRYAVMVMRLKFKIKCYLSYIFFNLFNFKTECFFNALPLKCSS